MADSTSIPIIVQGNSFSLAIPLQIYYINGDQMDLQDYTPDPTDEVSIQLKGSRRNYTYTPTIDGNVANIDLTGNELADNYGVVVSVVKANGQRLRSFRTDQFFIVESSDDLTPADIIEGLEENVIYLNAQPFIAGADGRGIESIVKTGTSGLVDTYTITYTDATTSTFTVTNGAQGAQGEDGVGITSIDKTSTSGLVDTYTITMSNSTTTTFDVTNGRDGVDLGLATIVDNLTEGGSTNVLSAEQGKVLNERLVPVEDALDISSSSAVVSERIPYALNIGYINGNSITTQTSGNNRYTDPIFLKAGESLTMKAVTLTNVGRLAKINPTTQAVTQLLQGTSASQAASAVYENTYTAAEDIYLIVGWNVLKYPLELTKTYIKTTTTSKIDDINAINDVLDIETGTSQYTEDVNFEVVNGQYYQGYSKELCTLQNSANFKRSEPFFVKAGESLTIVTSSLATSVSLLCVQEGNKYRNIVSGNNSSQTFNYTAPLDGYYVVSWNKNNTISVTKSGTRTVSSSERLDEIEESTSLIPSIADSVEVVNDAIFYHNEDDLTEDYVAGKYISTNGAVGTNSSFRYKEFEVSAGTLITFSSYTHSSCAPIAKKISSGVYEVLATAQGFQYETFSYTATENCVIALSCYGVSPAPKAVFERQNIATNTLQIENILADISAINKWAKRPDYGLLFDKVAVIGDSLTVGTLDAVSGDDAHAAGGSYGCSWLTCLAKKWGSSIRMHYGRGGTTCYSWLGSNDFGLGLMLKDSVVYDAYFIAYGHNDTGQYTVGTTSDTPTDVTVDANNDVVDIEPAADTTFLGNYKKIVNEIRAKAPNALIFMLCTDEKDSSSSSNIGYMNQKIKSLAEWYYEQGDHRVFYVDYINTYVRKTGDHTGGHWSTFGYVNIALAINDAMNAVIEEYMNTNALKAWGNYLESYRTTEIDTTTSGGYLPHL